MRDGVQLRETSLLPLRSVASRGLPELIAEQIVEAIRVTNLKPGDRLPPEAELCRQLGAGRTSVREALQKLQTLGIVEVIRGRGAFVCGPATDDTERAFARWSKDHSVAIGDLIEARIAFESANAGLAAVRATEEEIEIIGSANHTHRQAGQRGDVASTVSADQDFHEAVAAAAHNPLLGKIHAMLIPELTNFRQMTLAVPRVAERSATAHAAVVDAIRARDPVAARKAMTDHLWVLYEDVAAAAQQNAPASGELTRIATREALA
jgi:GntR family transcriptional regulator, transcriptional repressor for pyruvate dehydrogenase complex